MLDFKSFKLFESNDYQDKINAIKRCFNGLVDDEHGDFHYEDVEGYRHLFYVHIDVPSNGTESIDFTTFYNINKEYIKRLDDVKIALTRLEDQYEFTHDFEYDRGDPGHPEEYFVLTFDLKTEQGAKQGEFWQIGVNNTYRFDAQKLRKYLNVNFKSMSLSTNGKERSLYIFFGDEKDLEKELNDKTMINKLSNYKIDGKDLLEDREYRSQSYNIFGFHDEVPTRKYDVSTDDFRGKYAISLFLNSELKCW